MTSQQLPVVEPTPAPSPRSGAMAAIVAGAAAGAFVWLWCADFDGKREGWDDARWFGIGLPLLAALCLLLGYLMPVRTWRWAIAPVAAQVAILVIQKPGASLLPLGLVFFGVVFLGLAAVAKFGAFVRMRGRGAPA